MKQSLIRAIFKSEQIGDSDNELLKAAEEWEEKRLKTR